MSNNIAKNQEKFKIYSFDIFDTLVTRTTATPRGTISILQSEILKNPELQNISDYIKNNFYFLRNECEFYARDLYYRNTKQEEVSFEQIYDIFQENYNLTLQQRRIIEQLEINIEKTNLLPIHKNINFLKQIIQQKKQVILISDMYYGESILKELLSVIDPIFQNIKIYSSSDYGRSKHSGNLYKLIQSELKVEYSDWFHMGDNKISDYQTPRELGIYAEIYELPKLLHIENDILEKYPNNTQIQLLVGCSKNILLCNTKSSEEFILGATIGAQILIPYVLWILDSCIKYKIKKLYFIARDGFILKQIADFIISYKKLNISTKYIYGSRIAWQIPAIEEKFEFITPLILQYSDNFETLSQVLNLTKEVIRNYLPKKYKNRNEKYLNRNMEDICHYLLNNKDFKEYYLNINKNKKGLLSEYLQQEIDFSNDDFAFVDLCGSGHTQNCLAEIISNFYPKNIKTFYFRNGLRKVFPNKVERFIYFLNRRYISVILELFARAPHGQTLGYRLENNKVIPILEKSNATPTFNMEEYAKGLIQYTEFLCKNYSLNNMDIQLFISIYDYITQNIDQELANILGKIPLEIFGSENKNIEFAPKINLLNAVIYCFTHKFINKTKHLMISIARSSKLVQIIMQYAITHKTLRKELINIDIHNKKKKFLITLLGFTFGYENSGEGNK